MSFPFLNGRVILIWIRNWVSMSLLMMVRMIPEFEKQSCQGVEKVIRL